MVLFNDHACASGRDKSFVEMTTGLMTIDHDCPSRLKEVGAEDFPDFFRHPSHYAENAEERKAVRALLHEHAHWYQLLGSGHIANLHAAEHLQRKDWNRGMKYEHLENWHRFNMKDEVYGFSAYRYQLMKCHASFWEFHQASPKQLILDLIDDPDVPVERESLPTNVAFGLDDDPSLPYTGPQFDWAMRYYAENGDGYSKVLAELHKFVQRHAQQKCGTQWCRIGRKLLHQTV